MAKEYGIIDARTDEQWLRTVDHLIKREEWSELWKLSQKTPPIWTVRIVKHLAKRNWSPAEDEQPQFFAELCPFAASCNEFDLPGPDIPVPSSGQLSITSRRLAGARVTADGEMVFVMDDKAAAVEVCILPDLILVERIRLDMYKGTQCAVLGFAIDSLGNNLATLTFEPKGRHAGLHLYRLDQGEVISDWCIEMPNASLGKHVPRVCFSGDGSKLAVLEAPDLITVWDRQSGKQLREVKNTPLGPRDDTEVFDYPIQPGSSIGDWCRFGRRAIADPSSRGLAMSYDGARMLACRGRKVHVWGAGDSLWQIDSSMSEIAVSRNGEFALTLDMDDVFYVGLDRSSLTKIASCADPLARFAISEDSELFALALPHSDCIKIWHLPDGRNLGTLFGLAHDVLLEFRFTLGGSLIAVTRSGLVQTWEADGNGNAWPWSKELVQITHQPVDHSSVDVLRQAQEMRKRGWLSIQESNLLDLALSLMQHRLNLDIEIEWESGLPGDKYDIEID